MLFVPFFQDFSSLKNSFVSIELITILEHPTFLLCPLFSMMSSQFMQLFSLRCSLTLFSVFHVSFCFYQCQFDITVASEIMAILALTTDLKDMRQR